MRVLGKQDLVSSKSLAIHQVAVPELRRPTDTEDPVVCLRAMTLADYDAFQSQRRLQQDLGTINEGQLAARLLASSICDSAGELLLSEAEALQFVTMDCGNRLSDFAVKLNGMKTQPEADAKKG